MIIQEHQQLENGWELIRKLPHDSNKWPKAARFYIDHLIEHGSEYVKIGDTMYTPCYSQEAAL